MNNKEQEELLKAIKKNQETIKKNQELIKKNQELIKKKLARVKEEPFVDIYDAFFSGAKLMTKEERIKKSGTRVPAGWFLLPA